MMLVIMRSIVQSRRQRMTIGCAIVVAANAGGCFTVIGDPAGIVLWGNGAVSATDFSAYLALPALVAWGLPTWLLGRSLPERLDVEWPTSPYRGDDTNLNRWQRVLMLIVGIGGLWFIPTFHNITKLSPFLGALCVVSILWVVNEIFNRKLMNMDAMVERRTPRVLQYGVIQMMLFVMGVMLAIAVVKETGALSAMTDYLGISESNPCVWLHGMVAGVVSTVLDNFASAMSFFSFQDVAGLNDPFQVATTVYSCNGIYWQVIAYCVMAGGNVLGIGSVSGLAFMKMERVRVGWFFANIGWKALLGGLLGMVILWLSHNLVAGAVYLTI